MSSDTSTLTAREIPKVSHSQFGEDFEILEFFGRGFRGVFLDIGANDGIRDSNTLLLEENGWTGLLVEANPELAREAARRRPGSQVVNRAVGSDSRETGAAGVSFHRISGGPANLNGLSTLHPSDKLKEIVREAGGEIERIEVESATIDAILATAGLARIPDFVSLDIEGAELEALRGFDLQAQGPRLLLIEDNSRNVDRRIPRYLRARGYHRVHRTGVNDWYVRKEDAGRFWWRRMVLFLRFLKWRLRFLH